MRCGMHGLLERRWDVDDRFVLPALGDVVVNGEVELRKMAIAAGTTVGENGFTFGMLYAREQQIARECRQQAKDLR